MFKNNLKHSRTRGLSLILVLAMLISVLPFQYLTVNAEEIAVNENEKTEIIGIPEEEGTNISHEELNSERPVASTFGEVITPAGISAIPILNDDGVYEIESGEQLVWFRDLINGTLENEPQDREANAMLVADISMEEVIVNGTWVPIGDGAAKSYNGTFDGNNKEITGFDVEFTANYKALFGYIENAVVKDLKIDGNISSSSMYVAALAANAASSEINNCINNAYIKGTSNYIAGIVAEAIDCEIIECKNYGRLDSERMGTGGIVVQAINTKIEDCENYGKITSTWSSVGGIAAYHRYNKNRPGTAQSIINCKNYVDIVGDHSGEFAGIAVSAYSVIGSKNYGKIKNPSGQAVGIALMGDYFDDCINEGNITGMRAAGIVGTTMGDVLNCTNIGDITSTGSTGTYGSAGIVNGAGNGTLIRIEKCVNEGNIQGVREVGGIIGSLYNLTAAQSYDATKTFSMLKDCANYGNVIGIASGSRYDGDIGGLIGFVGFNFMSDPSRAPYTETYILNSFNLGDVSGKSSLEATGGTGGLVGRSEHIYFGRLILENSYNAGSVNGKKLTGGIIGGVDIGYSSMIRDMLGPESDTFGVTISNCYSAAESISLDGKADEVDKNTIGGVIGSIFFNDDANMGYEVDYSRIKLSNLFYNDVEGINGIGTAKVSQGLGIPSPVESGYMQTQPFVENLGGVYTLYEGEAVKDKYDHLFGGYKYPVLRSWVGLPNIEHYNVQFVGADYTTVKIGGESLYSTSVDKGGNISFTVASKYADDVKVISVSHNGTVLEPEDGKYILENIHENTVVTVLTEGEPTVENENGTFNVKITANPAESTIEVKDETGVVVPADGSYRLEPKPYTVTISAPGYDTKSGTFTPSKHTKELIINLVEEGTETHTLYIDSSVEAYIASDGLMIYTIHQKEDTSLELYPGEYTYTSESYGGGSFSITEDSSLSLKTIDYSYSIRNDDYVAYTMSVIDDEGREYFPGGTTTSDGDKRAHFLLPARYGKIAYNYSFNVNENYWASAGKTYVYNDTKFAGLNLSDSGKFVIASKKQLTMTVPAGSDLRVYQRPKFYLPSAEVKYVSVDESGDQWKYIFDVPANTSIYYELKKGGYVKKASFLNLGKGNLSINIPENQLLKASDFSADIKDATQGFYEANVLMNVDDSMYLQLPEGGEHELYLFRAWQAINSITGNEYIDPDYHFEVIYGDSVEIKDPYYAGATIKAKPGKTGISVVKVTYDALNFETNVEAVNTNIYSKLWDENYGVIIVNVGGDSSVKFDTGIKVTDFDTIYYTKSINGIESNKQYREYTFTPKASKNGTNVAISSVRVHEPIGNTNWKTNSWYDQKYWTSYNAASDGSYTVQLKDGRNIVEISAGGSSTYYSVNAYGLDITIDGAAVTKDEAGNLNLTAENGADAVISFKGLRMPVAKLGAISNPGFPDKTYLVYTESGGDENGIESNHTQYNIRTNNNIKLILPVVPGDYSLTGGKIHTSAITSGLSSREITKGGTDKSNYIPGQNSEENINGFFSSLPDLNIKIVGEMTAEQFAKEKLKLKSSLENVYKAYPESIYSVADLSTLKILYEAGIKAIDSATDLTEVKAAAKMAQDGIKAVQDRVLKENSKIIDFRSLLSRLPDDVKLLGQYNTYLVQELVSRYTVMDQSQKNQLTGMETEKYNRINNAFDKGLQVLHPYELSFEIAADTNQAAAAIKSMIQYIKSSGGSELLYGAQVYGRDADGIALEGTKKYSLKAYPDDFVLFAAGIDMFAYMTDGEISGNGWKVLNDAETERIGTTGTYNLIKGRTVLIGEVPYEIKGVEIAGVENIYGKQDTIKGSGNDDIVIEDAYTSFIMPYENAKIKVTWGPVISGEIDAVLAKAKTEAIATINKEYSGYKSHEYTDDNWINLTNIKDNGITLIYAEKEIVNIAGILDDIIAKMKAVPKVILTGTIDGFGKVLGTVDLYIENTTYSKGAFTGSIVSEPSFEYAEKDNMMTVILRALKDNGYGWTGTGGTKPNGVDDYNIQYLASITKDGKSLGEFDGSPGSGWMGTLNDFFTNYGFQEFSAKNGKLSDGDEIRVMFTLNLGADLGGTWGNSDTSLASLSLSDGKIYPSFDSNVHEYTVVMGKLPGRVKVAPLAFNRNYMVKMFLNDKVTSDREGTSFYKRTRYIPVKSGDYINIGVGEYAWPSMNRQETEARDYSGTWYKLNIISKDSGASHVVSLISSLTKNISIDSENEVKNIREIYSLLSPSEQAKVTNLSKLEDAEKKIAFFKEIEAVKVLLKKIPSASKISLEDKAAVMAADEAYKKLTDEQKMYITVGDVKNYNAAIDKLKELGAFKSGNVPSKIKGNEEIPEIKGNTIDIKAETKIINKTAVSKVTSNQIKEALKEINDKDVSISGIAVTVDAGEDILKSDVEISKSSINDISKEKLDLHIQTPLGVIIIPSEVLGKISEKAEGSNINIILAKADVNKLTEKQKSAAKENQVYDISILSSDKAVSGFGGQTITISLPYKLKKGQIKNNVSVWYLNDKGEQEKLNSVYDEETSLATFKTDHLSYYMIGYENIISFVDVNEKDWFYDSVMYTVQKGLFSGTDETRFSPNSPMTRAMLVTVLHRLEGKTSPTLENKFKDVNLSEWYTDAIRWSSENDIVRGITDTEFMPQKNITREQLAVMLYRYARIKGMNTEVKGNITDFTDSKNISSWAIEAINWATENKLVAGRENGMLDPAGNATRAEVAAILERFITKIVIK